MAGIILLILTFIYTVFILYCIYFWKKIPDKSNDELAHRNIKIAVIIPARNEAEYLPVLLHSLSMQNYPVENFQIIVSDDHSDDNTSIVADNYFKSHNISNGICLKSPGLSKKSAITFAIENCNAELIITTDADTTMGRDWIASIVNEYINSGVYMVCGPVKLTGEKSFLTKLQSIEFAGLIGIGAAGIQSGQPFFCNGANLVFTKKIFYEAGGYENSKSMSGDDTQLLLKIQKLYPGKISFLKDTRAIVSTNVQINNQELWQQRKRWASKIPFTLSAYTISVSLFAWLLHLLLLFQVFISFFIGEYVFLILSVSMKIIVEMFFLKAVGKFLKIEIPTGIVIASQPLYWLYVATIGLFAPFGTFQWKGRKAR